MTEDLKEEFEENGYAINLDDGVLEVTKKHSDYTILLFIMLLIVSPVFIFLANYKALMLVILLLCAPFVYTKWRMPKRVKWLSDRKLVVLGDVNIPFKDIQSISFTKNVRTSDVSPFKEGYQDFVYIFQIEAFTDRSFELFEFKYREPMESLMKDIKEYFEEYITHEG